ncbi:MAG TPA: NUDIX hydrolase [Chroococcales cyanobacterium]|jgi:ADP-ribose pyrophosphatase YjhB (NUDIX family)
MSEKQPRIRVAVVLEKDEKVLLVRHRKGEKKYWLLPGGGVDYGETLEECARREVREETGLEIQVKKMLYLSEAICPKGTRHILNLFLLGEITGGELKKGEEEILDGLAFVDFEALSDLILYPPIQKSLIDSWKQGFSDNLTYLGSLWNE